MKKLSYAVLEPHAGLGEAVLGMLASDNAEARKNVPKSNDNSV